MNVKKIDWMTSRSLALGVWLTVLFSLLGQADFAYGQAAENVLYIRAEFNDRSIQGGPGGSDISDATWANRLNAINTPTEDFWSFNSYGKITGFDTTITEVFQLPNALDAASPYQAGANPFAIRNDMVAMAQNAGYAVGNFNTVVLSFPNGLNRLAGGALGTRIGNQGTIWLPGDNPAYTGLTHEYGHALGVGHASTFEGGSETYPGEHREGRDGLFMMGSEGGFGNIGVAPIAGRPDRAPINLPMRYRMGFVDEALVNRVRLNNLDDVIRIHAFDREHTDGDIAAGRKLGAVFNQDNREWWVSFAPSLAERWAGFNGEGWVDGIIVQELSGDITRSLDFTPGSQGGIGNQEDWIDTRDGALRVGQTFQFPNSRLSLSPLKTGVTDGVPWIDFNFAPPALPDLIDVSASFAVDFGDGIEGVQAGFTEVGPGLGSVGTDPLGAGTSITISSSARVGVINRSPADDVESQGSALVANAENINALQDDILFTNVSDAFVDVTIAGLAAGTEGVFEGWFADTLAGSGAGATLNQQLQIDDGSGFATINSAIDASDESTTPISVPFTTNGIDPIVIRIRANNSLNELRINGFAVGISAVPEPSAAVLLTLALLVSQAKRNSKNG